MKQDLLFQQLEDDVSNGDSTSQSLVFDGRRSNTQSSEDIEKNGWILTPGRYVGAEEIEEDEK